MRRFLIAAALTAAAALGAATPAAQAQETHRTWQSLFGSDMNFGLDHRESRYDRDFHDSIYGDHGLGRSFDPYESRRMGRFDFDRYGIHSHLRDYGRNDYGRDDFGRNRFGRERLGGERFGGERYGRGREDYRRERYSYRGVEFGRGYGR